MPPVLLSKLLKKRQLAALVADLAAALACPLAILDAEENLLQSFAVGGALPLKRFPVSLQGTQLGWVCGDDKARVLAAILGYHAELELERRELGAETLHKYKEIALLYSMAEHVPSCAETEEIIERLIESLHQVITFDTVTVLLFDRENEILKVSASDDENFPVGSKIMPTGIMETVWHSGKGELVNDLPQDPRFTELKTPAYSLICTPLRSKETMTGLIRISSRQTLDYTAEDLKLLTTLSTQAAVQVENATLYRQLKDSFYTMVYTLAETIEMRDPYTGNHTKRVTEYSLAIGRVLKLSEYQLNRLELSAVLHDVGKIGVPDTVLLKQGPLDDDEFHQIKQHTRYGEEILHRIPQLYDIIPGVKSHHERFDGRGYPEGLQGDEIDIKARIIAVADTFDAMTTDRPYRRGFPFEEAYEELRKNAGTQFDPAIVDAFFEIDVMEAYFAARTKSDYATVLK